MAVRLEWEGKPKQVERLSLPFRAVETIGTAAPERNLLVWGDNQLVMASLLADYAGRINLVYIDPPFDTGADFALREPAVLEGHAYRDSWGAGHDDYLTMMYARLVLIHELLAEDGSLFLHCGPRVSHTLRVLCDEIFGPDNFRNEVVWKRFNFHADAKRFGRVTDRILFYSKSPAYKFRELRVPFSEQYEAAKFTHVDEHGRRYRLSDLNPPGGRGPVYEFHGVTKAWRFSEDRMRRLEAEGRIYTKSKVAQLKRYLDELDGQAVHELWTDVSPINPRAGERLGYPTQKPEALVERIIEATTDEGDLVADFFAGSGTTPAAAERLGRRWIACDLGRFAIHTTRKRLLSLPGCRPFDVKKLGNVLAACESAHVDVDVRRQGGAACVVLKDFAIPNEELIPAKVRKRIRSWSDLIDYWSVDYDFSGEVFHNRWRAYRTRENPVLPTQSEWHEYPGPGRYSIAVKVIDIFGNATTKVVDVRIK